MSELDDQRIAHFRALYEFARLAGMTDNPDVKQSLQDSAMGQLFAAQQLDKGQCSCGRTDGWHRAMCELLLERGAEMGS